eukprot:Phypoly_transcript_00579.p1 GENE.Phypoly_transcript_00579~~Phypoly_transcript_00579.p1  ORF type:complete len:894 (+),score=112.18 Phypoly_transcript_00579:1591-4272(+)
MGFPTPEEYSKHGLGESVPLCNSVNLADANRIQKNAGKPAQSLPPGKMLIVKSLIGKTMHARYEQGAKNPNRGDYPNMASVFRSKGDEPPQKQWYFFDNVVLLPEYLVEFEYVTKSDEVSGEENEETEDLRLMNKFTKECSDIVQGATQTNHKAVISQDPVIAPHSPVPSISDEWLQSVHPPGTSFSSITYLNISGLSLTKLEGLNLLVHLRILIASHNVIRKIEGLTDLKTLERLDLSNNQIKRIEGLKGLPLRALLLHSNSLSRLDDVILLKKYVSELTELDMRNNPVQRARGYKILVLRRLSKLTILDGETISSDEKASAKEATPTLTPALIRQHAYGRRHGAVPLSDSIAESDDWWTKVVALKLRHCGIRRLTHLEKLVNMRKADLGDNLIGRIDGLDSLKLLEDLCLDENCISRLDGLSKLANLRKLELSRNQIASAEGLENLAHLVQLSMEDNLITSLHGLQSLTNLMELYLGNNKISDRRELRHLKNLERLVILDLSGNDVVSSESYRLFVINKLKHLKVLDGQVIELEEQNSAKDRFAGRLTSDVLEEKIGHIHNSSVRALDLGNMKLKEIDPLKGEEFTQLREVTLDHNALITAKALAKLVSLEVLRLNHNRIEKLGFGEDEDSGVSYILPKLEVLELSQNCLTSMANLQLQSFPSLKILILTENAITRLEGLAGMSKLQKLVLDKNKIKSVDEATVTVANLPHLSVLHLEENYLKISACFSALTNLKVLTLGQNRIADIMELDKLVLPRLEELTLAGNAVARKLHYRAHAISSNRTLKTLDGRPVTEDERTKAEYLVSTGVVSSAVVLDRSAEDPNPPKKVALKPNMIDFGQMLALGTQVKPDDLDRSSSPKEWNSLPPGKATSPAVKTMKAKAQGGRSPSWK